MMCLKLLNNINKHINQDLVGDYLGSFHIDFELHGACGEINAKESLFLGKKYIDILESTDKQGNIINSEHIKMRGIPTSCIQYHAKQNNITILDI